MTGTMTKVKATEWKCAAIVLLLVLLITFPIVLLFLPIIALPVALVWYLAIGGVYLLNRRARKKHN